MNNNADNSPMQHKQEDYYKNNIPLKAMSEDDRNSKVLLQRLNHTALNSIFSSLLFETVESLQLKLLEPISNYSILERSFLKAIKKDYDNASTETIRYMLERMFGKPKEQVQIDANDITPAQKYTPEQLEKLSLKVLAALERDKLLKSKQTLNPEEYISNKAQTDASNTIIEG